MPDFCLTLICPPELEEKLLDLLLETLPGAIFTSSFAFFHGSSHALTTHEQVMGRSRAAQVQVLLAAEERSALFERLRADFTGTPLRYWITRLDGQGAFE